MPRRENSIYEGDPIPRTRESEMKCYDSLPRVKRHPAYVHGKVGMAMLLHKIAYVEMHWYELDYSVIHRRKHPVLIARTVCGNSWRLEAGRSGTCEMPAPTATICGMCSGTGRIWPRGEKNPKVTKRQAKDGLGCVAQGTEL